MRTAFFLAPVITAIGILLSAAGPVAQNSPPSSGTAVALPDPLAGGDIPEQLIEPIGFDDSDRMTLPVRVNGSAAVPFLVDTGSERTVVSDELALSLGLPHAGNVTISSVAGTAVTPSAHVKALDFTNISVNDIVAPVLKRGHLGAAGLIGIDSLQSRIVLFDFERNHMEIRPSKKRLVATPASDDEIIVRAKTRSGRLIVTDASVDGVAVTIVIDSGAQYSVGNHALYDKLLKRKKLKNTVFAALYSVTGQMLTAEVAKLKSMKVGAMEMTDIPVAFADSGAFKTLNLDKKPALLLGMNSLRAFSQVEVDFSNRRVTFTTRDSAGLEGRQRYAGSCDPWERRSAQCGQLTPSI